jgi:hypothetical protein
VPKTASQSFTFSRSPLRKGVSGLTPVPRHVAEVWVVEDVEELGSKTKPHAVLLGS